MYQQFSSLLNVRNDEEGLVKTNLSIQNAEGVFQKSIDSIEQVGRRYDEQAGTNDFQNLTAFFKTILDNRRFLSYLRLGTSSETKGSAGYIAIVKLQEELQAKNKMLATYASNNSGEKARMDFQNTINEKDKQLQNLVGEIKKEQAEKQAYAQNVQRLENELAEKNKQLVASANKKSPDDQKALAGMQNEITQKTQQIRSLEAQVKKEQTEKQTYVQGMQKLQVEIAEKNKVIAASGRKLPNDQKALVNLQTENAQKAQQIRNLEAQVRKEQSEKQTYAAGMQKLQGEVAEKNKAIAASSNKKSAPDQQALQGLQKELAQKNDQIKSLQTAIQKEQSATKKYAQIVTNLQTELIERNKLIAAAAGNGKTPQADPRALLSLQNEITEKNKRIRNLEDQLKQSLAKTQTAQPASGESLKSVKQSNDNLKVAYNNTLAQINLLTRKYNALKAENDQLRSGLR
jgi:chromosome segregation ATPase